MTTANLDTHDLNAAVYGGVIHEDVMNKVWEINNIPLPFTNLIGNGTHSNPRTGWVEDELATPSTGNAVVEGSDQTGNNSKVGTRLANFTQISVKTVQVSDTADAVNSIGNMGKLSYQVSERQKELRRDVEAQMLTHQGSSAGAEGTAAISAGLGAQLKTNVSVGATGSVGGFNTTTGLFEAPTPGTKRALSETTIRNVLQQVYEAGGNTTVLMARPPVIRALSTYMFGTTAKIATLTSDNKQSGGAMTAYGSVNVFVTDFGQTVEMRDNRLQAVDATAVSSMYMLDPTHIKQSLLRGYTTEPLGKTGLSDKRLMSVQYSLKVLNEKSQGAIFDIDEALAVVA